MNMKQWLAAATCAAALATGGGADAGVLALSPLDSGGFGNPAGLNLGYAFQVTVPISVTALAYFEDSDPDPLQGTHTVGIWRDGNPGAALALASVSPADPVIDIPLSNGTQHFYYAAIAPVTLNPGDTYVVSGTPDSRDTFYEAPFFTLGAEIAFVQGRYGTTAGGYAETNGGGHALLGGNFLYELASVTTVPEPSGALLLIAPLALLAARWRTAR